nr:PREDICTED: uncharacterized protein LOC109032456 isoform X2 [Bemisia tabaci]
MKLVPFLAVAALAVSAECLSLFDPSPSFDFSPELISPDSSEEWAAPAVDSSEEVPDLTPDEEIPSDLVFFRRGSVFRAAAHRMPSLRMPRPPLRRVIMVSVEPSHDEDQFESDEDASLPSPPANQRPWSVPRHRWPVTDLSAEEPSPFVFPTVPREHFDWPESVEQASDELSVGSEYVKLKNLRKLIASRLADGRSPRRAPAEWPQEHLKWPREVETPKKPAIMRPVTRVSTPSPFERGLEDLTRELKKAEQEKELDREVDAIEYKYHPNVVQIV